MIGQLVPVGPGIKDPAASAVLKSHETALRAIEAAGAAFPVLITTVAKLSAAPIPTNHIAIVTDVSAPAPSLAFSDGTHWYRADTNAVIV